MFSLAVRHHFMIAHSFAGEVFGPAQRLHGATYAVELELRTAALDRHGLVADIGLLEKMLRSVLDGLDFRNLDEETDFAGVNTTTEFLAGEVWRRARMAISAGALGDAAMPKSMRVRLDESPAAWAAYDAEF